MTAVLGISGCGDAQVGSAASSVPGRWYTLQQVELGRELFDRNCVACHGAGAVGDPNWRKRDEDGSFPPPPLNGTAHAWHHPMAWLHDAIAKGSPGGQGRMPEWGGQLEEDEIEATIAWFQSLWPEEIYEIWSEGNARYESRNGG